MEDFVQEATNWHFLSQLGPETLRLAGFSGHHYLQIFLQIFSDTFQETITYKYSYWYCLIFLITLLLFLQKLSDTFQESITYSYSFYIFQETISNRYFYMYLLILFRAPLLTDFLNIYIFWCFSGQNYFISTHILWHFTIAFNHCLGIFLEIFSYTITLTITIS